MVKGLRKTAKELENVVLIPQTENIESSDYYPEYAPPKSHYTYKGMKKIGERFAKEYFQISGQ